MIRSHPFLFLLLFSCSTDNKIETVEEADLEEDTSGDTDSDTDTDPIAAGFKAELAIQDGTITEKSQELLPGAGKNLRVRLTPYITWFTG